MGVDWDELRRRFIAYRGGDEAAARAVFTALRARLGPFVRLRAGGDADDLLQVCLLKMHFARESYDASRPLKAWAFTIAANTIRDHWRSRGRVPAAADDALEEAEDERLGDDLRLELNDALLKALELLTPLDRSIVYMVGVEQLSMAEAAAAVGLSENAVKLRLGRSYRKMRARLTGSEG